ncbi:MAG: zinc ribbon domain-containing protein [Alistipes finegoldii]
MALINCPECGNSISDQAPHCPKCGYQISNHTSFPKQKVAFYNQ